MSKLKWWKKMNKDQQNDNEKDMEITPEETPENAAAKTAAENGEKQTPREPKETKAEKKAKEPKLSTEEKLKLEVAELNDKYLRLQADYQNFRRRTVKDINMARQSGTAGAVTPFLHLFDIFSMAIVAAEKSDNMEAIKQGLMMINNEYIRTIDDMGVSKIDKLNVKFDPEIHEAISYDPSETIPEGHVTKIMACGYKLGDLLLRPARVIVSSGKAPDPKAETETAEAEADADTATTQE